MRKINIYKVREEGRELVEVLKKVDYKIYESIYKEKKELIVNCILKNEQKELLSEINYKLFEKDLDLKFFEYNKENIKAILDGGLDFDTLFLEYETYIQKKNGIPSSEKMTYQEIILYDYDEDETVYMKDFEVMQKLLKVTKNLYLFGNAGNGKTTFAYDMARSLDLKLFNINSVKNEFSVKGFFDLDGKYKLSLYEKWYRDGGVLLLDEVDSYSSNGMLYLNNGVEVNSKYLTLEDGSTISKHQNCYVIACANTDGTGKTSDYIGRNAIDKAFMSRFIKKEYKEYAYIHKKILGDNYDYFKSFFDNNGIELTCRLCVKLKGLLEAFTQEEVRKMLIERDIEL